MEPLAILLMFLFLMVCAFSGGDFDNKGQRILMRWQEDHRKITIDNSAETEDKNETN